MFKSYGRYKSGSNVESTSNLYDDSLDTFGNIQKASRAANHIC